MDKLNSVIRYFVYRYPHSDELSSARLTKMVYLADWLSAVRHGHQISSIRWVFNHYGPYVEDVSEAARQDADVEVISTENAMGATKTLIRWKALQTTTYLTDAETAILDHVIEKTERLTFNAFIKLVYATYPVMTTRKYEELALIASAHDYLDQNDYRDHFI